MKLAIATLLFGSAAAFAPSQQQSAARRSSQVDVSKSELVEFANDLNPAVKYFDPLQLADRSVYEMDQEATIGWLRHSEIKHSRVAMLAFVGYCVQSNFHLPLPLKLDGTPFPSTDLSPEQQWDAIPAAGKWQFIAFIGLLEILDESGVGGNGPHYTKGRTPGDYPGFNPYGNASAERKAKGLAAETNNGRLAMLGIFGFVSADSVPGSVPLLDTWKITIPYTGNFWAPFETDFHFIPQ